MSPCPWCVPSGKKWRILVRVEADTWDRAQSVMAFAAKRIAGWDGRPLWELGSENELRIETSTALLIEQHKAEIERLQKVLEEENRGASQ